MVGVTPGREAVRPEAVEAEESPGTAVDPGVGTLDVGRAGSLEAAEGPTEEGFPDPVEAVEAPEVDGSPEAAEEADRADLRAAVAVSLRLVAVDGHPNLSAWGTPNPGETTGSWNSIRLRGSSRRGANAHSTS